MVPHSLSGKSFNQITEDNYVILAWVTLNARGFENSINGSKVIKILPDRAYFAQWLSFILEGLLLTELPRLVYSKASYQKI